MYEYARYPANSKIKIKYNNSQRALKFCINSLFKTVQFVKEILRMRYVTFRVIFFISHAHHVVHIRNVFNIT